MSRTVIFAILGTLSATSACGPAAGGAAKAKLELQNVTGAALQGSTLTTQAFGGLHPSSIAVSSTHYFAMKLASVYLAQDIDPQTQNNVGESAMLWVSPHCTNADDCDLFDFARPTDLVNADLNSQELDVPPGTYRYVRMEFCYHGDMPTLPNVEWQGGDMPSPHGFIGGGCGVTSKEFNPPLVLAAGDSVAVALGYDLSNATSVGQPDPNYPGAPALTADDGHGVGFNDCVVDDAGTTKTCFTVPDFVPSAVAGGGGPGARVVAQDDAGASGG